MDACLCAYWATGRNERWPTYRQTWFKCRMSSPKLVQMCLCVCVCVCGGVCAMQKEAWAWLCTAAGLVVTAFLSLTQRIENGESKWE